MGSHKITRRTLALAAATLMVLVAGVAAAYWTAEGGGAGSAATGTASALTLSPGTPTAQLFPSGNANVVLTMTNPNPTSVQVASLALDTSHGAGGFGVDGAHSGCSLSTLGYATQTNGGTGWTVPAGATLSVTLPDALSMTAAAANACQGAIFTVYLAVS